VSFDPLNPNDGAARVAVPSAGLRVRPICMARVTSGWRFQTGDPKRIVPMGCGFRGPVCDAAWDTLDGEMKRVATTRRTPQRSPRLQRRAHDEAREASSISTPAKDIEGGAYGSPLMTCAAAPLKI